MCGHTAHKKYKYIYTNTLRSVCYICWCVLAACFKYTTIYSQRDGNAKNEGKIQKRRDDETKWIEKKILYTKQRQKHAQTHSVRRATHTQTHTHARRFPYTTMFETTSRCGCCSECIAVSRQPDTHTRPINDAIRTTERTSGGESERQRQAQRNNQRQRLSYAITQRERRRARTP